MRKIFLLTTVLLAFLLLLPLSVLKDTEKPISALTSTPPTELQKPTETNETVKVFMNGSNQVKEMPMEDYLFGVVAGEMPALYEKEALKAQAVCAYTFALWRKNENAEKEYDITDDYTTDQCYITTEIAREKWGSKAAEYETKIKNAIAEVKNQKLTFGGELALSVYHSLSSGKTESAKNVWGKDYPYLQTVSSESDKLAKNYVSTETVTAKQICSALSVTLPEGLKGSFMKFNRTDSGTVKTVLVGGKEFTGSQIRKAFNLKSSNFTVELKNNMFIFTVYGYGHGVGMSQNGANEMAKQGSTYEEILNHYYTGCQIMRNS